MKTDFASLPAQARLWIYAADRPLSEAVQNQLLARLDLFLATWKSHGRDVMGAATIYADQFLMLGAYLTNGEISGCGIDASVHQIESLAKDTGFSWASPLLIYYRNAEGEVCITPRNRFRQAIQSLEVNGDTFVFDLALQTIGDLHTTGFEKMAANAWHARIFRIPQPLAT